MLHKTLTQVRHVLPLETLSRFELQTNPRNSVALFCGNCITDNPCCNKNDH
ncbi:hypothetical protein I3679_016500 [Proteus mirabilis]|uniref:Uncharacterized protein n=1 Tax=Proteus mirabilis TaxID=584 RepID=A0ABD5LU94_PROMI